MNRPQLTLLALVSAVVLLPCHADQPAARAALPAKAATLPAQSVLAVPATATSNVNRAALNPQPLPPGPPPDPDRLRATNSAGGTKNGIIIVGGSPAQQPATSARQAPVGVNPNARKLKPLPIPRAPDSNQPQNTK